MAVTPIKPQTPVNPQTPQNPQAGQMRYIKGSDGQVKRVTGSYALQNGEEEHTGSPVGKSLATAAMPMAIGGLLGLATGASRGNALGGLAQGLAPGLAGLADTGARLIQERDPDSIMGAMGAGALSSAGSLGASTLAETARRGGGIGEALGNAGQAMLEGGVTGALNVVPGMDALTPMVSSIFESGADGGNLQEGLMRGATDVMSSPDWGGKLGRMGDIGNVREYAQGDYGKGSIFSQDKNISSSAMREQGIEWQQGEEKKFNDMQKEQTTQQQTLAEQQKTIAGLEQKVTSQGGEPGVSQTPGETAPPVPGADIAEANKALINTMAGLSSDDLAGMTPDAQRDLLYLNPFAYTGTGSGKDVLIPREARAVRAKLNNMRMDNQNAIFYNKIKSGMNKLAGMLGIKKRFDDTLVPHPGIPEKRMSTAEQTSKANADYDQRRQAQEQQRKDQASIVPTEAEEAYKRENPDRYMPTEFKAVTTPDGKKIHMPQRRGYTNVSLNKNNPIGSYALNPAIHNHPDTLPEDKAEMHSSEKERLEDLLQGKKPDGSREGNLIDASPEDQFHGLMLALGAGNEGDDKAQNPERFMSSVTLDGIPHEMYPLINRLALQLNRPDLTTHSIALRHEDVQNQRIQAENEKQNQVKIEQNQKDAEKRHRQASLARVNKMRQDAGMAPLASQEEGEEEELGDIGSGRTKPYVLGANNEIPVPLGQTNPTFQNGVNTLLQYAGIDKLKKLVSRRLYEGTGGKELLKERSLAVNRVARKYGLPTSLKARYENLKATPEFAKLSDQQKEEVHYAIDAIDKAVVPYVEKKMADNFRYVEDEEGRRAHGILSDDVKLNDYELPDEEELARAIGAEDSAYAQQEASQREAQTARQYEQQQAQSAQDALDVEWAQRNEAINAPEVQPQAVYQQQVAKYNNDMEAYNQAVTAKQQSDARIAQDQQAMQTLATEAEGILKGNPKLGFTIDNPDRTIGLQPLDQVQRFLETNKARMNNPDFKALMDSHVKARAYRDYNIGAGDMDPYEKAFLKQYATDYLGNPNYFDAFTEPKEQPVQAPVEPQKPKAPIQRAQWALPPSSTMAFKEMPTGDLKLAKTTWAQQKPKDDMPSWDDYLANFEAQLGDKLTGEDLEGLRDIYDADRKPYLHAFEEWRQGMVNIEEELSGRKGDDGTVEEEVDPLTGQKVAVSAPRAKIPVGRASAKFMLGAKRPEDIKANAQRAVLSRDLGLDEPASTIKPLTGLEPDVKPRGDQSQYDLIARLGQVEKDAVGEGFTPVKRNALKVAEKHYKEQMAPLIEQTNSVAKDLEDIQAQISKLESGLKPIEGPGGRLSYPKGAPLNASPQDVLDTRQKIKDLEQVGMALRDEYIKVRTVERKREEELKKGMEDLRKYEAGVKARRDQRWQEHLDAYRDHLENATEEEYREESAEERLGKMMDQAEIEYSSPELQAKQAEERRQAMAIFDKTKEQTQTMVADLKDLAKTTEADMQRRLASIDPNVVNANRAQSQAELSDAARKSGRSEVEQLRRMPSSYYDKYSSVFSNPVREEFVKRMEMEDPLTEIDYRDKDDQGKDIAYKRPWNIASLTSEGEVTDEGLGRTRLEGKVDIGNFAETFPAYVQRGKYSNYIYLHGLGPLSIGAVHSGAHEKQSHGENYDKICKTIVAEWNSHDPERMDFARELYEELPMLDRGYEDSPRITPAKVLEARKKEFEDRQAQRAHDEELRLQSRQHHADVLDVMNRPPRETKHLQDIRNRREDLKEELPERIEEYQKNYEDQTVRAREAFLADKDQELQDFHEDVAQKEKDIKEKFKEQRGIIERRLYNLDRYREALAKGKPHVNAQGKTIILVKDLIRTDGTKRPLNLLFSEVRRRVDSIPEEVKQLTAKTDTAENEMLESMRREAHTRYAELSEGFKNREASLSLLEQQYKGARDKSISDLEEQHKQQIAKYDAEEQEIRKYRQPVDTKKMDDLYNTAMAEYVTIEHRTKHFPRHANAVLRDIKTMDEGNKEVKLLLSDQQSVLTSYRNHAEEIERNLAESETHVDEVTNRVQEMSKNASNVGTQVDMLQQVIDENGSNPELSQKMSQLRAQYDRYKELEQRYRSELRVATHTKRGFENERDGTAKDIESYSAKVKDLEGRVKKTTENPVKASEGIMQDAFIEMDDLVTTYNKLYEIDIEYKRRTGKYWELGHKRIETLEERLMELDKIAKKAHDVYQKYTGQEHGTYEAKRGSVFYRRKTYDKAQRKLQRSNTGIFSEAPQIPVEEGVV
jgi:hypothetical protein